jgi:hypothetical protein
MTTNIDLLRLFYEYEDTLDSWGRSVLLAAAMPGVADVKSAWAEVEHLVALLDGLDPRVALDMLKGQDRLAGGHSPQDAYQLVVSEAEAEIVRTVHAMRQPQVRAA